MAAMKSGMLGLLSVGALLAVVAGRDAVTGDHAPRHAPAYAHHRALQSGSNIVWIDPLESDATELQVQSRTMRTTCGFFF